MAFTPPSSKLSYYHTFSKLPVEDSLPLGSAINKGGHTVSAAEVWTCEIPYFGKMGSTADITTNVTPYAKKNDMVQITSGADKDKVFRRNGVDKTGKAFADLWEDITSELVDGAEFKNSDDDTVLVYHKDKKLELLDEKNNANITSKNNASRLWVGENENRRLVEQFVGVTDRSLNGLASVAYAPIVIKGTTTQVAGTNYYDYCVSGTILWAAANTTDSYITCFEYIGPKVAVSIKELQKTLKDGVLSDIELSSDAEAAGFEIDKSSSTKPSIKFTKGEVEKDSEALVTGGDVWAYITELHSIPQLSIEIVENPAEDWTKTEGLTITKNTIYLVKASSSDPALSGSYIEYIAYVKKDGTVATEKIGSTKLELSDYYTKDEVDDLIPENYIRSVTTYQAPTEIAGDISTSGVVDLSIRLGGVEGDWFGEKITLKDGNLDITRAKAFTLPDSTKLKIRNSKITGLVDNRVLYSSEAKAYSEIIASDWNGFLIDTNKLLYGNGIFNGVTSLIKFESKLDNMMAGTSMFSNTSLKNFAVDMPRLQEGLSMFECTNSSPTLVSFVGNLSNLQMGRHMFNGQSHLKTVITDLSSLTDGYNMFKDCKLTTESLEYIAESINDVNNLSDAILTIDLEGWGPSEEEDALLRQILNKGWDLYVGSSPYEGLPPLPDEAAIDGEGETVSARPFYAKPVEVSEEEAEWTDADGKFYRILGAYHIYVKDPENYGMFTSLEDAAANMRLTKYEKIES